MRKLTGAAGLTFVVYRPAIQGKSFGFSILSLRHNPVVEEGYFSVDGCIIAHRRSLHIPTRRFF
jgi:hypothetical protein